MSAKRGESGLSGILVVDKPSGLTSHDVVNRVRNAIGERRVGHAGTLDPMATGVLVVLVGPATRLAPYLSAAEKTYLATIVFGSATDTDDAEGRAIRTAPVPEEATDPFAAAAIVASLVGEHDQVPPAFSAIKVGGKTAYREARSGETLDLEPRRVAVTEARLLGIEIDPEVAWDVELTVSKGTYVRAIARDLGAALGTAAHLGALRRTRSGNLSLDAATPLDEIETAGLRAGDLFHDPVLALGLPALDVDSVREASTDQPPLRTLIRDGRPIPRFRVPEAPQSGLVALSSDRALLAIYEALGDNLVPRVVFHSPVQPSRDDIESGAS